MRKIFKFSFLALFMVVASCEDATDIVQESELNDDAAFRTIEDLQSGLNGVYNAYGPDFGGNGQGDAFLFNDLFTDNLKRGVANLGQGSEEYNFVLQPSSTVPTAIWGNRYATINFANRVMRALNRLEPSFSDVQMAQSNRIRAELLAMRALCHFDLLQYFAPSYQERNAPGVIIMNFVPELDQDFPRSSVGEVFDFVNADLDQAASLIGGNNLTTKFYLNRDGINAIKARVAIFEGNTVLAETLARALKDAYPLSVPDQYASIWADNPDAIRNGEVIFALARLQGDPGVAANWFTNNVSEGGNPLLEMSNQLFDLYQQNDVRREVFILPEPDSDFDNNPENRRLLIGKYPGSSAGQLVNHIKLFRTSEMVLILAEAQARNGNLDGAEETLETLTDARHFGADPLRLNFSDLDDALEAILIERRKELAFEGHRFLDLKRLGRELNKGVDRDPADCSSFAAPCSLAPTDYRFTLPIPQTELSANPSIQQNTGY